MAGIPIDTILGALPEDLKSTGIKKFPQLILSQGIKVDTLIQPVISKIKESISKDTCLPPQEVDQILTQRNNIVDSLNNVGVKLNNISSSINSLNNYLTLTLTALTILKGLKSATSLGIKLTPLTPGFIVSLISDVDDLVNQILFDKLGSSRLRPISNVLSASSLSVSIVNSYIKIAIDNLNNIDNFLKKCPGTSSSLNLTPLSETIEGIVFLENQTSQTLNQSSYKGFILQVEEVPYNDKVNQRKAIAVNQYGIKMIETPLSFTTNPQTLIGELKLIIDRDNLKAD